METLKIKRITSGYYSWEYNGYKGTISKIDENNYWYFQIGSEDSNDWHSSLKDTKLSIIEYVNYLNCNNDSPYLFEFNN